MEEIKQKSLELKKRQVELANKKSETNGKNNKNDKEDEEDDDSLDSLFDWRSRGH